MVKDEVEAAGTGRNSVAHPCFLKIPFLYHFFLWLRNVSCGWVNGDEEKAWTRQGTFSIALSKNSHTSGSAGWYSISRSFWFLLENLRASLPHLSYVTSEIEIIRCCASHLENTRNDALHRIKTNFYPRILRMRHNGCLSGTALN